VPSNSSSRIIRFSTFEVNLDTGELRQRGQKVKLQEQPFQVLAALLERPGEVVTREELRSKLWPTDTFVDFDHGLNAAIKRLRDALGESAERPVFIETLARRGYRFIAPVNASTTRGAAEGALSPPTPAAKGFEDLREGIRSRSLPALRIVVVSLVGALLFAGIYEMSSRVHGEGIKSLAVLPLDNLSRDPQQEYFSDGMTDVLTDDLSKVTTLRVVSRTSAMRYKATKKPLAEIARELNVDGVIEGSVLRSGNRVRITAELIDARTDRHLWGQTYERDLGDVLMLQSEVAQTIAERIHARLTTQEQSRVRAASVVNPDAYEAYLKARFYGAEVTGTRAALKQAQGYYGFAVRKDPTFALAYAGLADCYLSQGAFRLVPPQDAYRQASAAIHKALQLDATLAEAHGSLGYLDWQFEWNWQQAERELRYAVELNPNSMKGNEALVWYLAWSGRRGEALAEVEKMRQLDPAYPFISLQQSGVYYHQRDYKSLIEAGKKSVAAYPNGWSSHYFLAVGYEGSGRPEQAIPEYQRAVELSEADTDTMAGLAHAYVASGKRSEAEKVLRELQTRSKTDYVSPYMIGAIYAGLGNKDKAFEFLEKAYKEKSPDVAYFLKADLRIDSLRSDPRFQDLLQRMNFQN
jgi:TolB-like protein/DNA-binding winged helix-turn-helix (wHTH) protein/Tfp pilus assembly protein PilF